MTLLDTTTVSALMRGDDLAKRRLLAHRRTGVATPQTVVAEIEYGLARLPKSRGRARLRESRGVVSRQLRRAEWTDAVSEAFGRFEAALERQGTPIDDFDLTIAAHAVALDAILATSNLSHFERIPELVIEVWLRRAGISGCHRDRLDRNSERRTPDQTETPAPPAISGD